MRASQNSRKIQMNLASQNETIGKRLEKRKERNSSLNCKNQLSKSFGHSRKSFNFSISNETEESDVSAGGRKSTDYERELEQVMEKYVLEKLEARNSVKRKYQEEINTLKESFGEEEFKYMQREMQKNMEKEIRQVEESIDLQRKEAIQQLRQSRH